MIGLRPHTMSAGDWIFLAVREVSFAVFTVRSSVQGTTLPGSGR